MRSVSVVIPVKGSQRTIRATVDALLGQRYDGPIEVVLVGDPDDPTWDPIRDHVDAGRVLMIEVEAGVRGRDANIKRNVGLEAAGGEVLCLTDSDMIPGPDWIATGVRLLDQGWPCVAGPMAGVNRGFWGQYVDGNAFVSKTPRMERPYVVSRTTLGTAGHKPPITANVMFTRAVYGRVGGLDPSFTDAYDDYEWFQRIADAGFDTLCTPELVAAHHHRQGWRDLLGEYRVAGRGCAQFVRKHGHSRLARDRMRQLGAVLAAAVVALLVALAAAAGLSLPALVLTAATVSAAVVLSAASAVRAQHLWALAYPAVTLVLGLAFVAGMLAGMRPAARS